MLVFIAGTVYYLTRNVPDGDWSLWNPGWLKFWETKTWIDITVGGVVIVWFTWGGVRDVRQLLTESLVLAVLGGALGVGLAFGTTGFLDALLPPGLFKVGGVELDGRVLGFTLAVTLITPFVFGLLPALSSSRAPVAATSSSISTTGVGGKATVV